MLYHKNKLCFRCHSHSSFHTWQLRVPCTSVTYSASTYILVFVLSCRAQVTSFHSPVVVVGPCGAAPARPPVSSPVCSTAFFVVPWAETSCFSLLCCEWALRSSSPSPLRKSVCDILHLFSWETIKPCCTCVGSGETQPLAHALCFRGLCG